MNKLQKLFKLPYSKLESYLVNNIQYGYKGNELCSMMNPLTLPVNYIPQTPNELLESLCGLSFDVVELVKAYMEDHGHEVETYILYYSDQKNTYALGFAITKMYGMWHLCPSNNPEKLLEYPIHSDKEEMLKLIYKEFQDKIKRKHKNIDILNFYFDKYDYNYEQNISFLENVLDLSKEKLIRKEYSSMSIVLCKNKILTLITSDNKYVLPKGHIEGEESTLETSIRECKEETGVELTEEDHLAEIKGFGYSFKGANCKYYTNSTFYEIFKVGQIDKHINVHIFNVEEERATHISEPENFKFAQWIDIDDFKHFNSYKNQKQIVEKALKIQKARVIFTIPSIKYAKQLQKFRQEMLEEETHINGSRGLHHYENINDWLEKLSNTNLDENHVPSSVYLLVDYDTSKILGIIDIRHYLNDSLKKLGGHIGYSVVPSERQKGYGKLMLELALVQCDNLNIKEVLITCDNDNFASASVIISNGGKEISSDNPGIRKFIIKRD